MSIIIWLNAVKKNKLLLYLGIKGDQGNPGSVGKMGEPGLPGVIGLMGPKGNFISILWYIRDLIIVFIYNLFAWANYKNILFYIFQWETLILLYGKVF